MPGTIRYIHAFVGTTGGRATVAWHQLSPPCDIPGDAAMVEIAIAWCSPKDNFVKRKGRLIAEGRMQLHGHVCFVPLMKLEDGRKVLNAQNVLNYAMLVNAPRWAQGKMLKTPHNREAVNGNQT